MSIFKKSLSLSLIPLASSVVHAQTAAVPNIGVLQPAIVAQPGQYKIDNTAEIANVLAKLQGQQYELDRQYIEQTMKGVKANYDELLSIAKRLGELQSTSADGSSVSFKDAANLRLELEQTYENLSANLESITSLPSTKKESPTAESAYQVIMAFGRLDLGPVVKPYLEGSKKVVEQLSSVSLFVSFSNDEVKKVTLNDLLKQAPKLSSTEIQKKVLEAQQKRQLRTDETKALNNLAIFTRHHVMEFISTFGDGNKYRGMSEGNKADLEKILENIESVFWLRSLARTLYGTNIGVIGIDYEPRAFHLDTILTSNKIKWISDRDLSETELTRILSNYTNMIESQETNNKDILGSDVSFISRLNSLVTRLQGERNLVDVNLMVLSLLAADLKEELIVMQGGAPAMKAQYIKRYFKNDEIQQTLTEKRKFLFGPSNTATGADSLAAIAKNLQMSMKGWQARIAEANSIEATIEASMEESGANEIFDKNEDGI